MNLPKGFSYIIVSVVAGLVATVAIHRYVAVKTRVPILATGKVAVAATNISPGSRLSAQSVREETFPQSLIPADAAASFREVEGRVVNTALGKGEPILHTKLAPKGAAAGLSGLLAENKRALTVRVDDVTGVAGFIHPGDRVDVLADLKVPKTEDNISKTILQNIPVLTTGQIWEEQKGDRKPVVVNTVTLELSPGQSEVLTLASNNGKIRLALRNPGNKGEDATSGITVSQLINGNGASLKGSEPPAPAVSPKETRSVELIKGLDRSRVNL